VVPAQARNNAPQHARYGIRSPVAGVGAILTYHLVAGDVFTSKA
jgi:hypothetical protein